MHKTVSLFVFYLSLFLAVLGPRCCAGLSLVVGRAALYSSAQASHCSGFSCCRAWALEHMGFGSCGP